MNYAEWIKTVQPHLTRKGARLDLRLYIYPDGHGNICVQTPGTTGQPVNSPQEASRVLLDLWDKAALTGVANTGEADVEPDLAMLLDRITPENIHHEVDSGSPVGHEVW